MGLVYSRTGSGLVLAEHGADEAAVACALKQHDPDLRLVRQPSDTHQALVWKVYRYAGSEREAEFVLAWVNDNGEPLPLSFRLLDEVKRRDRSSAGFDAVTADQANTQLLERRRRKEAEGIEAATDDWLVRERSRPILHRGIGLRLARDKRRARGEKV